MTWESRTGVRPGGRLEEKWYWPILESPQHSPPRRPASAPEMGNSGDPAHSHILGDPNDLKVEMVSRALHAFGSTKIMLCNARQRIKHAARAHGC